MPVTKIKSRWDSGNLIFHESTSLADAVNILTLAPGQVTIGNESNDVDFKIWMGSSNYVLFDYAAGLVTFSGLAVTLAGDLIVTTEDISVIQGKYVYFAGQDDDEYIVSDTTDHLMLNAKTLINLAIDGTDEVTVSGAALYPSTDNGQTLGILADNEWSDLFLADGGVIGWNDNDVTITHGTDTLTLASTWTVNAVGRPWGVNLTLSVLGGNYVNAIKGYVDCTTNDGGTIGLLSAVNCEIKMPDVCRGAYYPLEIEWVGKTSTAFGDPGTGSQSGFMSINCSGFRDSMNSKGVFFTLTGLTAGTGGMLGAGSSTLRIDINQGTTCYIPLSTAEASYTTEYPIVSTYGGGDATANAFQSTITNPTIDSAEETSYGFGATINVGGATGWSNGLVAPVFGQLNIDARSPGDYATGAGGWFEMTYAATLTADGIGLTAGLYVKTSSACAAKAPVATLYLEDENTGSGNTNTMPILVLASKGTEAQKSKIAIAFGYTTAGAPVGNDSGMIYYNETIRVTANGNVRFIPLSTEEGTYTTAYPVYVGTDTSPITITSTDYQLSVHTLAVGASGGWFNAVVFDTEMSGTMDTSGQLVGVQAYVRLTTGSAWEGDGGACGLASVLTSAGSSTQTMGMLSAMTASCALDGFTQSGSGQVGILVIQNQADINCTFINYSGLHIWSPGNFEDFKNAIRIDNAVCANTIWMGTPTACFFYMQDDGTFASGSNGSVLNDISSEANQGFMKVLVGGAVRYIALYAQKT